MGFWRLPQFFLFLFETEKIEVRLSAVAFPLKKREELQQMPQSLTGANSKSSTVKIFIRAILRLALLTQYLKGLQTNFVTFHP